MANIDAQLNTIRKAENGESVRDAIADAIDIVNRDGAVTLTKLTATHNGRWKAGDGIAYKEVSVNVEGGGSSSISMESFKVDIDTANGEYKASEVIGENKAWDTIIVDTNNDLADSMGEIVANEEKDYYPEDYGYSGFNKVTVRVTPAGEGPFTVNFWSDASKTTLLGTDIVVKGGTAHYNGPALPSTMAGSWIGWNPNPSYVTMNMDCVPRYSTSPIETGEITDDWPVILAKRGRDYPIGSYKSASLLGTAWGGYGGNYDVIFCKVAEGEQGTASTWISRPIYYPTNCPGKGLHEGGKTWLDHPYRSWANSTFYESLPDAFKEAIKPVTKYSVRHVKDGSTYYYQQYATEDKIWVPSTKEVYVTSPIPGSDDGSGNTWFYSQNLHYGSEGSAFSDSNKFASWNAVIEDAGYYGFVSSNESSLAYFKDFLGNNQTLNPNYETNSYFFRSGDRKALLRDGRNYGDGYGPSTIDTSVTVNIDGVDRVVKFLDIRDDSKETHYYQSYPSKVYICFCLG